MYVLKTQGYTHTLYVLRVPSRDTLAAVFTVSGTGSQGPSSLLFGTPDLGGSVGVREQPKGEGPQPREVVLHACG